MAGHVDDAVQAHRLHVSAGMEQGLTLDHAWPEAEIVEHIFGIHAEHFCEVPARSHRDLTGIPDKGGDLIAANAFPAPDRKVEMAEI